MRDSVCEMRGAYEVINHRRQQNKMTNDNSRFEAEVILDDSFEALIMDTDTEINIRDTFATMLGNARTYVMMGPFLTEIVEEGAINSMNRARDYFLEGYRNTMLNMSIRQKEREKELHEARLRRWETR